MTRLSENGKRTELIINKEKTKCIIINPSRADPVSLEEEVEDVDTFKYLGDM